MSTEELEQVLQRTEAIFVKLGAVPTDLDRKNRARFSERKIFSCNGSYYRAGSQEIDGELFIVLSRIDSMAYADVGVMEDVETFSPLADDAEIERAVRQAMELEPF